MTYKQKKYMKKKYQFDIHNKHAETFKHSNKQTHTFKHKKHKSKIIVTYINCYLVD
jgi:hypothetical protein